MDPYVRGLPADLQERYRLAVASYMHQQIGVDQAESFALRLVQRLNAWRLRSCDAKRCRYCGVDVLWRHEGDGPVKFARDGVAHHCQ